jgi:hypothetical protein
LQFTAAKEYADDIYGFLGYADILLAKNRPGDLEQAQRILAEAKKFCNKKTFPSLSSDSAKSSFFKEPIEVVKDTLDKAEKDIENRIAASKVSRGKPSPWALSS